MQTIAIIGTGRMGSLLAKKLSSYYNLILLDKDLRRCGLLAKEVSGLGTCEYSAISNSDYIITALPEDVISEVVKEIRPYVKEHQIVINISTNTEISVFNPLKDLCKLVSAKIIGHARHMMETSELPLIIVDGQDNDACDTVARIFSKIGAVRFGKEEWVKKINNIASEEGIRAALSIRKRLEALNVPEDCISFAIRNVACGTMSAFALDEGGPFVQKIIKKLSSEESRSKE